MNNTNLERIKSNSRWLAEIVEPEYIEGTSFLKSHPFTNTCFDIEEYDDWLIQFNEFLDSCNDLIHIYRAYHIPWKLFFMKLNGEYMSDEDFAEYLADAWVTQDNPNMDINVSLEESVEMFKRADKKHLMTEDDYEYYQNLPEQIEVYRGVSEGRVRDGLSWTDNKETAEWFKNRYAHLNNGKDCVLLKAVINKKDVLAYFNTRNEKELVVDVFSIADKIEVVN